MEVDGVTFLDWDYSCITLHSTYVHIDYDGIMGVRIHDCFIKDHMTLGMDIFSGCGYVSVHNNHFQTIYNQSPIVVINDSTKSVFINGACNHINVLNNTFIGPNINFGFGVLVAMTPIRPRHIVVNGNTMRSLWCAIAANADVINVIGNMNDETFAGGENAHGWFDGGCVQLVIFGNQTNV